MIKDILQVHSGQIGWQNPYGHSLHNIENFSIFRMLLDIERPFILVRALLEQDLHAQTAYNLKNAQN